MADDPTDELTFVASKFMFKDRTVSTLPNSLVTRLEDVFASQAQQFKGYVFNWGSFTEKEVRLLSGGSNTSHFLEGR
jgi:hypothetical protein